MTEFLTTTHFSGAGGSVWVGGVDGAGKSSIVAALTVKDGQDTSGQRTFHFDNNGPGALRTPGAIFLLVVDASRGLDASSRRQAAIAHTAGYRHLVVAVNKMDFTGWSEAAFATTAEALQTFTDKFAFSSAVAIPVSAIALETLERPRDAMPWYAGLGLQPYLTQLDVQAASGTVGSGAGRLGRQFAVRIACVGEEPIIPGREYNLKLGSQMSTASISSIKFCIDPETLNREPRRYLATGEIGACIISASSTLAFDETDGIAAAKRLLLTDRYSGAVVAAGTVDFALRRGTNIHVQSLTVAKIRRAAIKKQRPCIVWFTGLSGSGKSTIANALEHELVSREFHTYMLDGDNIRHGLNKDLGFTAADRVENVRRVGEVAKLFVDAGTIVLCSFISPFRAERAAVRAQVEAGEFIEVHVNTPLAVCEARDSKGLYAKARAGELPNFTGIDSPYEAPERPDIVFDMSGSDPQNAADRIVALLRERGIIG